MKIIITILSILISATYIHAALENGALIGVCAVACFSLIAITLDAWGIIGGEEEDDD